MKFFLPRLPKSFTRHLPERLLIIFVFLLALVIAYWSITKRYPLIGEYQKKSQSIHSLEDEVQRIKAQYPEQILKETESGYLRAMDFVFTNEDHIKFWFDYFQQRAGLVGLEMKQQLISNDIIKTVKAPIFLRSYQVELKPLQHYSTNRLSPHERLLSFLYELSTNQYKRLDFVELKAAGDGNQLEQAIVGIKLWYFTNAP